MDNSITFSVSSGGTRDHSPERVRRKLDELESNLSALGHVGLVKHQRDLLRTELRKQTYLTDHARQSASSLRKLVLRLAVQVSARDSKLDNNTKALAHARLHRYLDGRASESQTQQLLSILRQYEQQGQALLEELGNMTATIPMVYKCKPLQRVRSC